MLTQSGPVCDVCGSYILFDSSINPFSLKGCDQTLLCHDKCKPVVLRAVEEKNWKLLTEGPIRRMFEEAEKVLGTSLEILITKDEL